MAEEQKIKLPKVSNMYGRARRLEFAKKCVYVVLVIIAVYIVFKVVTNILDKAEENVDFAYLREYMEMKGYACERIDIPGGKCSLRRDVSSYIFIRYENGFEYLIKTSAYSLTMRHAPGNDSKINFKTTTEAFQGYKSKEYNCSFKDNVVGGIEKCVEVSDGSDLDSDAYRGVINMAMQDMNELIDRSGYNKKKLLKNFEWVK